MIKSRKYRDYKDGINYFKFIVIAIKLMIEYELQEVIVVYGHLMQDNVRVTPCLWIISDRYWIHGSIEIEFDAMDLFHLKDLYTTLKHE